MLELYHWEPNAASARVIIALKEKRLDFQSRYVDVLAFEQHTPAFLKLNESGETPVLVREGEAYNEASYICEYLEEAFPDRALMPSNPLERWQARSWQKYVDDHLAASVSDLAWAAYGAPALNGRNLDVDTAVQAIPMKARRDVWADAVRGYEDERLDKARGRVELTIRKMEADLARTGWLAGGELSLADIAVFAYANYLPGVAADLVNAVKAPNTMAWLKRMSERPAVKAALAMAKTSDPYATAAPGPEHVRWG